MPRREYYQKNKIYLREYNRRFLKHWREVTGQYGEREGYRLTPEYKLRVKAKNAVNSAIHSDKIIRGKCEIYGCRNKSQSDAHHPDYSKPLDVVWLCRLHHMELHSKLRIV